MALDQKTIDELIRCPKLVTKDPSKWKLEKGHYRMGFELQSVDEQYFFTAFGRYNAAFNENFSFGLIYFPKEEKGSFEILRCNGPHGEHRQFPHHVHYHIHKATQQNIEDGLKEDSTVEITAGYTNFDEALRFFVDYIKVEHSDVIKYFPQQEQNLFDTP
jgi:hypothetical protein